MLASLVALLLLFVCHAAPASAMGVVGIDYGAEFIKVSLVKPGKPFDVVLSRDSKRKIPAAVAWNMAERFYGSDAINLLTRFPGDTFIHAKQLLGRGMDQRHAHALQPIEQLHLGTHIIPTDRDTCGVRRATDWTLDGSGADEYSVEEIVGMQLSHAKQLAEETAEEEVVRHYPGTIGRFGGLDVVLTVPIFYTAAERQAISQAAEIAGFRAQLVSDGAAAAITYAMPRNFPKPERHLLYDAGAGSTRATVVEISTQQVPLDPSVSIAGGTKEAVVIDVLGAGWDREANGLALDRIVRDAMVEEFEQQQQKQASAGSPLNPGIRQRPRAMARLLKEAGRVKQVLSVNAEASFTIEGLVDDVDFRGKVTRERLEAAARELGLDAKFGAPVGDALRDAKLKLSDLHSVILVGGTTRVPLVQRALRDAGVPDDKVSVNVNADEAAVMGAAFYGASFNPSFRMKNIRTHDGNPYPVLLRDVDGREDLLFGAGAVRNATAVRYYRNLKSDFNMSVSYHPSTSARLDGFGAELFRLEVTEVDNSLAGLRTRGELDQVELEYNVTVAQRPLGVFYVDSAHLHARQKPGGVVGALRSFFNVGGGAKSDVGSGKADGATKAEAAAEGEGGQADGEDAKANATSTKGNGTESDRESKEPEPEPEPTDRDIPLLGRAVPVGDHRPLSGGALQAAKDRLYVADVTARAKAKREEARNQLESYVYRARELVESDAEFGEASRAEERRDVRDKASELAEWLGTEEGETSENTALFESKRAELERLVRPVQRRLAERRGRRDAVRKLSSALEETRNFVDEARANLSAALAKGEASKYSVTELDSLQSTRERDEAWLARSTEEQAKRTDSEEPAFKVDEVERRARKLRDNVARLRKRRIPKTRPPKKASGGGAGKDKDKDKEGGAKGDAPKAAADEAGGGEAKPKQGSEGSSSTKEGAAEQGDEASQQQQQQQQQQKDEADKGKAPPRHEEL